MKINSRNSPIFAQAKWDAFVATYRGPYDLSGAVYAGMNRKVGFLCPVHGAMQMDAKNLMAGRKCMKCAFAERAGKPRMTTNKVLSRFKQAHADKYDYSKVVYSGQQTPVDIGCPKHGLFRQKPEYHWNGAGCPKCFHEERRGASQRDTIESFRIKLQSKFNGLFDLVSPEYSGTYTPVQVRCTAHSEVLTTRPNYLLNGFNPCPRCNHMRSKGEDEVARLLSNLTTVVRRDRTLIAPKELDIYLPEHALAVEYCGEYHHAAKSKDEEKAARIKHSAKHEACAKQGIRLLTIWESEWQSHRYAVQRLLRNAVGASRGRLMARKCELKKVPHSEAAVFYDRYHPQGGAGTGEHFGLYWKGKLVACVRFTHGANDRGSAKERVWTLSRYATRITVAGAASRLFKAFVDEFKPPMVKSFSDNRFFGGAMYRQLGFQMEEETGPDYMVWSPKLGLRPKSHYQRRLIAKRLQEHGLEESFDHETDTRTEAEMTYLMGACRLYDCGKKRWVWTA